MVEESFVENHDVHDERVLWSTGHFSSEVAAWSTGQAAGALEEDAKAEWYELQEEAKKKHAEQYPEYAKRVRGVKKRETSSHECKDVTLSTSVENRGHSH